MKPAAHSVPTVLTPEEQRLWHGLRTVTLITLHEIERGFRRYGLVHLEYEILCRLCTAPDGLRLGDLASEMHVSPSRLSHRLEKLTSRSLMTVEPSDLDGRVSVARIAPTGRLLAERLAARHEADVRRLLLTPLGSDQVVALADGLSTIVAALTGSEEAGSTVRETTTS